MSNVAIRVRGLGKEYRIGQHQTSYKTMRDRIGALFSSSPGPKQTKPKGPDKFWAVKDVSFDIAEGEVVGVIGRNGAGKSTLLKLMSRITSPTAGMIEIAGRIGSLLEVGTGFHPELSGRENIFMNGAILGMANAEIERKLDAIVEFAEVEKFIDTAVKHYSSGMYLRLAFAVAAHLEPEILIVDEVLAVGDAAFQKKCLGKMDEVSKNGRTVLFVSHNMVAVEKLCTRGIVMERGSVAFDGPAREAIDAYLTASDGAMGRDLLSSGRRSGSGEIRIARYELLCSTGKLIRSGDPFTIRLHFRCEQKVKKPSFAVSILTRSGLHLFSIYTTDLDYHIPEIAADGYIDLRIHSPNLLAGSYILHFGVADDTNHWYDLVSENAELDIEPADVYGTGRQRAAAYSLLFYQCSWDLSFDTPESSFGAEASAVTSR